MALGEEGKQELDQLRADFVVLLCGDWFNNRIQTPVPGPEKPLAASTVRWASQSTGDVSPSSDPSWPNLETFGGACSSSAWQLMCGISSCVSGKSMKERISGACVQLQGCWRGPPSPVESSWPSSSLFPQNNMMFQSITIRLLPPYILLSSGFYLGRCFWGGCGNEL